MAERRRYDRWLSLGLVVLLLGLGVLSFDRARRGRYDFHHFYIDARYVWENGRLNPDVAHSESDEERQLPFYLPVVPLLLSPVAAGGRLLAALIWSAGQIVALGYSLIVLRRWCADRGRRAPAVLGVALLLSLPALIEAARFNQLSFFVLALVLGGGNALDRDRPWRAGVLLGVATVLKLLPAIFLPWLLLKRRWSAAAAFVIACIVVTLLPPAVYFGPRQAAAYHRQWFDYNIRGQSAGAMLDPTLPEHFIDRRNQSITHVLARWAWHEHPYAVPWQPLNLSREACLWVGRVITLGLGALLLAATGRPWRGLTLQRRHAEAAAYAIGMFAFSPLLRQYYLVWALPAVVMLAWSAADEDRPRARRLGWIGLAVWTAGMIAWIWPMPRVVGTHLLMLIALAVLLLAAVRGGVLNRAEDHAGVVPAETE